MRARGIRADRVRTRARARQQQKHAGTRRRRGEVEPRVTAPPTASSADSASVGRRRKRQDERASTITEALAALRDAQHCARQRRHGTRRQQRRNCHYSVAPCGGEVGRGEGGIRSEVAAVVAAHSRGALSVRTRVGCSGGAPSSSRAASASSERSKPTNISGEPRSATLPPRCCNATQQDNGGKQPRRWEITNAPRRSICAAANSSAASAPRQ